MGTILGILVLFSSDERKDIMMKFYLLYLWSEVVLNKGYRCIKIRFPVTVNTMTNEKKTFRSKYLF